MRDSAICNGILVQAGLACWHALLLNCADLFVAQATPKVLFLAMPGFLRMTLEAESDGDEFRSKVSDALFALMATEGVDAEVSWKSSEHSRAQVKVTLRDPHDQAFTALQEVVTDTHRADTEFTKLELPPQLNLWLLLDVIAATVNEMYALSIKAKGLQRMCDAISVRTPQFLGLSLCHT